MQKLQGVLAFSDMVARVSLIVNDATVPQSTKTDVLAIFDRTTTENAVNMLAQMKSIEARMNAAAHAKLFYWGFKAFCVSTTVVIVGSQLDLSVSGRRCCYAFGGLGLALGTSCMLSAIGCQL